MLLLLLLLPCLRDDFFLALLPPFRRCRWRWRWRRCFERCRPLSSSLLLSESPEGARWKGDAVTTGGRSEKYKRGEEYDPDHE